MTSFHHARARPALFVRLWRLRLARLAMKFSRFFADIAEAVMPADLRHCRACSAANATPHL